MLEEGVGDHLSDEGRKFEGKVDGFQSGITSPLDLVAVVLVLLLVAVSDEGNALQEDNTSKSDHVGPHNSSGDVREDYVHGGDRDEGKTPEEKSDGPHAEVTDNTDEFRNSPPGPEGTDGDIVSDDKVPVEFVSVVDDVGHGHHTVTEPGEGSSIDKRSEGVI